MEIKSDNCSVRKFLALASPRANKILSIILLYPEPFGPEIVVNPSKKGMLTFWAKDLKLSISISLMRIFTTKQLNGYVISKHTY